MFINFFWCLYYCFHALIMSNHINLSSTGEEPDEEQFWQKTYMSNECITM